MKEAREDTLKVATYVVIGGGYAGLHALRALRKAWNKEGKGALKLVLIDKQNYHFRKVLLFKPAVAEERLNIPFSELLEQGVEFICGEVFAIDAEQRDISIRIADGTSQSVQYDRLVLALGSVVRRPTVDRGGFPLTSLDDAHAIRQAWRANLQQAALERDEKLRKSLLTIAIAGAGISGIETAGELAHYMRKEAQLIGLASHEINIILYNAHARLIKQVSSKLSRRLEDELHKLGVRVIHNCKVVREQEGIIELANGQRLEAGVCIWTTGLQPNPMLKQLDFPITEEGKLIVDASYRVQGHSDIYAIGDCAHIVEPTTGRCDGNTCREGIAQAVRLAKVLLADQVGLAAPRHEAALESYCFSLGPNKAIVWVNKWGLDMIISGKISWRLRQYTWDFASLLN